MVRVSDWCNCQFRWCINTTLAKNIGTTRVCMTQARNLSSMHASMFGLRGCLNFFGQGSTSASYHQTLVSLADAKLRLKPVSPKRGENVLRSFHRIFSLAKYACPTTSTWGLLDDFLRQGLLRMVKNMTYGQSSAYFGGHVNDTVFWVQSDFWVTFNNFCENFGSNWKKKNSWIRRRLRSELPFSAEVQFVSMLSVGWLDVLMYPWKLALTLYGHTSFHTNLPLAGFLP